MVQRLDLVNGHSSQSCLKGSVCWWLSGRHRHGRFHHEASSEVELGDGSLPAALGSLVVDAFAVAFHLGQVLVEDLSGAQGGHQVIKLPVLLTVLLGLAGLSLLLPLLLHLGRKQEAGG